jgi:hypothetical protein
LKITSIHDLLKFSKEYRLILQTITQIVPLLSDMFIQLFLLILFYSSVGNYLFGGEVDNTTKEKFNSEVGDNMEEGYEFLTFNDTPSSMLFLYAILINNDWSKLMMQAMAKKTEQPMDILWGRVFFISYYFLTFMVVLSTIVGAVVDFINTYLQMLGEEEELEKKSEKKTKATQGLFGIMRKKKHKKKTHSDSEDDGTDNKKLAEIDENYVDLGLAE